MLSFFMFSFSIKKCSAENNTYWSIWKHKNYSVEIIDVFSLKDQNKQGTYHLILSYT